jgi:hypothetical protein
MTEKQWLTARRIDPLRNWCEHHHKRNPRKERLFACACCRRIWEQLRDERSRAAIEAAEAYADRRIDRTTLSKARAEAVRAEQAASWPSRRRVGRFSPKFAQAATLVTHPERFSVFVETSRYAQFATSNAMVESAAQAGLLREIFGNPFRPSEFASEWRSDTALSLARHIYESRDFAQMPILADALQDAGCDNADILSHCRDPQQVHVRGCWVVDLVLGKE